MPPPDPLTWRCRRDQRCAARTQLRDPTTAEHLGWEPAMLRGKIDGLCTMCEGRLDAALAALPVLLTDLNRMIGRDQAAAPLDPTPRGGSKTPPIPLRVDIEAVRAWLHHETATWAGHLGAHYDNQQYATAPDEVSLWLEGDLWWAHRPHHIDLDARARAAIRFLTAHTPALLALPLVAHPLGSDGEHPHDFFPDPDAVTINGRDQGASGIARSYWADQDGTDAAITLTNVAHRAERVIGHNLARERSSTGCLRCGNPTMTRLAGEHHYRCPRCRATRSEDDQDVLRAHLLASNPESPVVAAARHKQTSRDARRRRPRRH